eukprot:13148432-Alexandrium_andersonii.AAC.1
MCACARGHVNERSERGHASVLQACASCETAKRHSPNAAGRSPKPASKRITRSRQKALPEAAGEARSCWQKVCSWRTAAG